MATSRTTKPELERALIASQRDNAALREQLSIAQAQIALLSKPRATPVAWPTATRPLPAHFAAAREAAMRMGRSVKVTV